MSAGQIIAFDPGTHAVAWAALEDGKLKRCGLERGKTPVELLDRLDARFGIAWAPGTRAIIEWPQVYRQRHWKGDPNDLVDLAAVAGVLRHLCRRIDPKLVRPHEWKGSVPKDVMNARVEKRLDEAELLALHTANAPASLRHNIVDAIGLGLWAQGRLGRG